MSWVELSLIATFLWASINVIDKVLLTKFIKHPVVSLIILSMTGLVVGIVFILFRPTAFTAELAIGGLIGGLFYFGANYSYFQAVKQDEVSRVIPIINTAPLFLVFLGAIFLGEQLTLFQYLGVVLLVGGAVLISIHKSFGIRPNIAFWFAVGCAIFFALNQLETKYLLEVGIDFWAVFSSIRIGTGIVALPFIVKHWNDLKAQYHEKGVQSYALVTGTELLNLVAVLLFTIAVSEGPVTLVNALSSVQPLFVLILTIALSVFLPHILSEEIGKKTLGLKTIAIAAIVIGSILVST
jgi:drug/metabolite transporter (DMT)-like permease